MHPFGHGDSPRLLVLVKAQYEAVDHLLVLNRQIDTQVTEELNEFAPRDTSRYRI